MAFAFDPNRTYFRGKKQVQTNKFTHFNKNKAGKGIKGKIEE